jgi:hypothetical protein
LSREEAVRPGKKVERAVAPSRPASGQIPFEKPHRGREATETQRLPRHIPDEERLAFRVNLRGSRAQSICIAGLKAARMVRVQS